MTCLRTHSRLVAMGLQLRFTSPGSLSHVEHMQSLCCTNSFQDLNFLAENSFFSSRREASLDKVGCICLAWCSVRGSMELRAPTEHGLNNLALFQGASHCFALCKDVECLWDSA